MRRVLALALAAMTGSGPVGCRWGYETIPENGATAVGGQQNLGGSSQNGGSVSDGGSPLGGQGGELPCLVSNESIEICDGLDNDCNGDIDESGDCPAGCFADSFQNGGYLFCAIPVLYADAEATCAQSGMLLAQIETDDENIWVNETSQSAPDIAASFGMFLGGTDLLVEGEWRWADGTQFWEGTQTGMPIGNAFANWSKGEPNNKDGSENCLGMYSDGTWVDLRCSGDAAEMAFVCETQ